MTTIEQASLDQRWNDYRTLDRLHSHWYWRPGWRYGRRFYTWHLTFKDQPALHSLSARVQQAIDLPYLSLVPDTWLHLTMQGLGFTDEITDGDLSAIIHATQARCADIPAFDIALGPIDPDSEGVGLLIRPWQPIINLRAAIRTAIATIWPQVPEPADGFRPHVTLAYSAADISAQPLRDRLTALRTLPPATAHIDTVELIRLGRDELGRDEHVYQWDVTASVPLARPA